MTREKHLSTLYPLFLGLTLAGYPVISSLTSIAGIDSSAPAILFRFVILAVAVLVFFQLDGVKGRLYKGQTWLLIGALWLMLIARLTYETGFSGQEFTYSTTPRLWIFALGACLLPMIATAVIPDEAWIRKAHTWALHALMFAAVCALGAALFFAPVVTGFAERASTERLAPIPMGHLGVTLCIVSLWPLMLNQAWRGGVAKLLFGFFLGAGTVIVSASRGPFVILVVVCLLMGAAGIHFRGRKIPKWTMVGGSIIFIGGPLVALLLGARSDYALFVRLMNSGAIDAEAGGRATLLPDAFSQFTASPLLGSGMVEVNTQMYPHNFYLEAFMATGIFGGFIMLALVFMAARCAWRLLIWKTPAGWLGLIFIQYMLYGAMSLSLYLEGTFWTLMALMFTLEFAARRDRQKTS